MRTRFVAVSLTAGLAAGLAGCAKNNVSVSAIRGDLTPELRGTAETGNEGDNAAATYANMQSRMFMDDIARTFYWDHPSRLSPYPITYTSGNPR